MISLSPTQQMCQGVQEPVFGETALEPSAADQLGERRDVRVMVLAYLRDLRGICKRKRLVVVHGR